MSCDKFSVCLNESGDSFTEDCLESKSLCVDSQHPITNSCYDFNDSPATQVAKFIRGLKSERIPIRSVPSGDSNLQICGNDSELSDVKVPTHKSQMDDKTRVSNRH